MNYNYGNERILGNIFPGSLHLAKNSTLKVDYFKCYAGARISVNEGAILQLGRGYINYNSSINCYNQISIGNNVKISENVIIRDSDNHLIEREGAVISAPIIIDDNVWIGTNCIILKGVHIGEGAVIGAGSIVTRDIPPHTLAVGAPAKVIRNNVYYK